MRGPAPFDGPRATRPALAPATVLSVTGGSAGVSAQYDAVLALADRLDRSAEQQRVWAAHSRSVAADPDLLESGLLAPQSCARAEAAVLATAAALLADAAWWQGDSDGVHAAIGLLRGADEVARAAVEQVDRQLGFVLGFALLRVPGLVDLLALGWVAGGDDRVLTDHPRLFTHLADGSGGLITGLATGLAIGPTGGFGLPLASTLSVEDAARLAAAAYGDEGHPVVRRVDVRVRGEHHQPTSVHDLVAHLAHLAALSPEPDSPLDGTIEVQTLTGVDGNVRHVVYLPGTDDLTTTPWSQDGDVRDMATNLQLMAGEQDTYQRGIVAAIRESGVRPGEPVALVGHSQGGMEAAALLAHHGAGLHVTDVVTAGSPTDQVGAFPAGSHVLSLEQRGDIVPLLDGRSPVDSVPQTTIVFDAHPGGGVLAHHAYPTYVAGAAAVDASTDPSVGADVASLHAHGFLGDGSGVRVTSQVFQITRG